MSSVRSHRGNLLSMFIVFLSLVQSVADGYDGAGEAAGRAVEGGASAGTFYDFDAL